MCGGVEEKEVESCRHEGSHSRGALHTIQRRAVLDVSPQLPHKPVPTIPRGGGTTADHVDILGNTALNEIILKVATGAAHEVQDTFVSNIREYAKRVQWD